MITCCFYLLGVPAADFLLLLLELDDDEEEAGDCPTKNLYFCSSLAVDSLHALLQIGIVLDAVIGFRLG